MKTYVAEFKELSKWMLALLEAWVCGDAPWLFRDGQNVAVLAWLDGGNECVIALAQEHGITPKTHPPKAPIQYNASR